MRVLLSRLSLGKKFVLLGVMGFVLFLIPMVLYVVNVNEIIAHKEREVSGVQPALQLLQSVQQLQQHRGVSAMVLSGDKDAPARRQAIAGRVDTSLQALADQLVDHGMRDSVMARELAGVQADWRQLRDDVSGGGVTGAQSFQRHTDLVTRIFQVNDALLDAFRLSLDPDLDTNALLQATFVSLPMLTEEMGKARARGAAMLTQRQATQEARLELMGILQRAEEFRLQTARGFGKAEAANPVLSAALTGVTAAADRVARDVIVQSGQQTVLAQSLDAPAQAYFDALTQAIDTQFSVVDTAIQQVAGALQAQVDDMRRLELLLLGASLGLALLMALIALAIARSVTRSMANSVHMARSVAQRDLTVRATVQGSDEAAQLLRALNTMSESLAATVDGVRVGAESISGAAAEIASGNRDLSARTESQAASVEETAAAMRQLTDTVRQNDGHAQQAHTLVETAFSRAQEGGEVVEQAVRAMEAIRVGSRRMADITEVMEGIAFQTNILALNASVEAARAGEQGRGFAVVASEVRGLAQRSASSAREIKALIDGSVAQVGAGSECVDRAGTTMREIVDGIRQLAGLMSEIRISSAEQATGIEQVNQALGQIEDITRHNASLVEQVASAADGMREQTGQLSAAMQTFRLPPGTLSHS